jgi:putative membrane protein
MGAGFFMSKKRLHYVLLIIVLIVFIWSAIKPTAYSTWVLEVSPAVVSIIVVLFLYKKFPLTTLSYTIIAFVTILMFIGGHYVYSNVPLFDWLKDTWELKRNHYDRFGHFMKGLIAIVIREILLRKTMLYKGAWLNGIVISIVLAIASLYEIVEWVFAKLTKGGKASKDFLGTQGDIWDTQWDMVLTLAGSILALILLTKMHDRLLKREIGINPDKLKKEEQE